MTRTEIVAAVCVNKKKEREALALRHTALRLVEIGYYTIADYDRFCIQNNLKLF